jgi:hypothetical protein
MAYAVHRVQAVVIVGGLSVAEWTLEDDVVIIDAEKVRIGPSLSRTLRPESRNRVC